MAEFGELMRYMHTADFAVIVAKATKEIWLLGRMRWGARCRISLSSKKACFTAQPAYNEMWMAGIMILSSSL